jgi:hypothetical protein
MGISVSHDVLINGTQALVDTITALARGSS